MHGCILKLQNLEDLTVRIKDDFDEHTPTKGHLDRASWLDILAHFLEAEEL